MRATGRKGAGRGQSTVEFAMVAVVFIGLLLAIIDLARAGFTQHTLDLGAADLAQNLATISGTNANGQRYPFIQTPLDPSNVISNTNYLGNKTPRTAIQAALSHAAALADHSFSDAALSTAGGFISNTTTTISNTQVTVVGTPNLTAPTEITVTIATPFQPAVGTFLKGLVLHLQAREAAIPNTGP